MDFDQLINQKNIVFVGKDLRDGDIDVLVEVLQKSSVLEDINLMCNQITLADGKFTDALANNRTLKVLSLYQNQIKAEGAKKLADALKVNQSLERLFLEGNQVGDEGTESLADAMRVNKTLHVMILRGNGIGDKGAQRLATSFLFNQGLRVVLLGENEIGNKGCQALAYALEYNHLIDQLMLDGNKMSSIMDLKIKTVLSNPSRKNPKEQQSVALPKEVVETIIEQKDKELADKEAELVRDMEIKVSEMEYEVSIRDKKIIQKEEKLKKQKAEMDKKMAEITNLNKEVLNLQEKTCELQEKLSAGEMEMASLSSLALESPLELLALFIQKKDEEIASLKATIETSKAAQDPPDEKDDATASLESYTSSSRESSIESYYSSSDESDHTNENVEPVRGKILKSNPPLQHKNVKKATETGLKSPKRERNGKITVETGLE